MIFFLLSLFSTSAFQRKGFVRENEQPQDFWAKTWASLIENCNSVNVVFDQILAHFEKALQDFGIFYFAAFAVLVLFVIWPKKKKEIKGVKVNLEFLKEIKQLSHVGGLGGKRSDGVEVGVGVGVWRMEDWDC